MYIPKIVKICAVDDKKGIHVEWTIPQKKTNPAVIGYVIAYRRNDLDIDFSARSVMGVRTRSIVISPSKSCSVYDFKVAAFSSQQYGEFCQPVTWCQNDKDEIQSSHSGFIPIPRILKLKSVEKKEGVLIEWHVPLDVSSLLLEGFIVAYKRCSIDLINNVKMVPGGDVTLHVLEGLQSCTLYEIKVAAYTTEGKGKYCVPMIIRTGVTTPTTMKLMKPTEPRYTPKIVRIHQVQDPSGIFVKWTPPVQVFGPSIQGYVVAFREVKAAATPFSKCFIKGENSLSHVIPGLRQGNFEVKIAAFNISGEGPYTLPRVVSNFVQRRSKGIHDLIKQNLKKLPT